MLIITHGWKVIHLAVFNYCSPEQHENIGGGIIQAGASNKLAADAHLHHHYHYSQVCRAKKRTQIYNLNNSVEIMVLRGIKG